MACQCYGCHDSCDTSTKGCSSCSSGCSKDCGDCGSSCGGSGCKSGCQGCDTGCTGGCKDGCDTSAKCSTCKDTCTGTAKCGTCTGSCEGCSSCSGGCDGCSSCSGGCDGCSGGCSSCSDACSNASKRDVITNLGKNILKGEYIREEDFLEIKKHITEEFKRRGVSHYDENFTSPVPSHGGFVLAAHAKKCFQAIANYNPNMNYTQTANPGAFVKANSLEDIIAYLKQLMEGRA